MSAAERHAYDRHLDNIMVQNDVMDTARIEGLAEGRQLQNIENARNFKRLGVPAATISQATGLSVEEIERL